MGGIVLFTAVVMVIQLAVTVIVGVYFYRQIKAQEPKDGERSARPAASREMDKLNRLRRIRLSEPLSERVRPTELCHIVGQQEGVRALKAILCGPNPQHVIVYGPPGVGKTCAARLVLEAAKQAPGTPFAPDAPFIEMDATCVRFDERAIADPLLGSVHDPIYQGAGPLGVNGVPQPKEGAVTRAHGGVLFLDEIGELHPIQMNKLLKVLEDRKVRFESAYYDPDDTRTPRHIHEIFQHGLPADFRLVGATTRSPEDLPPALRSRCMEVFFRSLEPDELKAIALGAAHRTGQPLSEAEAMLIGRHSASGRDAVNMVQMAAGVARGEGRSAIARADVEWVIESGHYAARPEIGRAHSPEPGRVNALAVHGAHQGVVMELEAVARPGRGRFTVTGIVDSEQLGGRGAQKITRTSTARAAFLNVLTTLRAMGEPVDDYDIHLNFPGGTPVDGPSAGAAMAVACYSAIRGVAVRGDLALTGELSVMGRVLPVGGVTEKIQAAVKAGMKTVLIPEDNALERYGAMDIEVVAVRTIGEVFSRAIGDAEGECPATAAAPALAAEGLGVFSTAVEKAPSIG